MTQRPVLLRIAIAALAVLALAVLSAAFAATQANAGAGAKLTVNSLSNTDDGQCNGPPNDLAVGNCTLHEAFVAVNNGTANEINFHPAVFPQSAPGVIQLELGLGALPPLFREVRIDAKGVGVVLDGDFDDDGIGVPWGINVIATHNAFDFELNGGGHTFIIREVGCGRLRGGGSEGVSGNNIPILCLQGGGDESVSDAETEAFVQIFGGVGILISGLCSSGTSGGVAGPDICCADLGGEAVSGFLCEAGSGDDSVSGPPILIGGPFSLGDILIDGIEIHNAYGSSGILMEATNMHNIHVTNSWIEAEQDGIGIFAFSPPALPNGELFDNNVHINGNRISGGENFFFPLPGGADGQVAGVGPGSGSGVDINFCCDLGSKITADVSNNSWISGNGGHGVWLTYCWNADCSSEDGSAWNFSVNNNGKISGQLDAVNVEINSNDNTPDPLVGDGSNLNADIEILNNDILDGEFDDGIDTSIDICCANSDSMGSVVIEDNLDIVGDDNAVDVDQFICCSDDNTSYTSISDNGELTGEGDDGLDIEVHAGSGDSTQDSDENTTTVDILSNDDIAGDNGEAIEVTASSGKFAGEGDADRNVTEVNIIDNDHIDGDDDGAEILAFAGTQGGPGDADDNEATVTFTDNDDVDGADDEGIEIDVAAGTTAGLGGPVNTTGDHNTATALVNNNDDVKGHDGNGIEVFAFAGGHSDTGEGNATVTQIIGNDDIAGFQGGDGIHTENIVCCDADGSGTNDITISGNDNIIGHDEDGIDVDTICCSFNTVTIQENDNIRGDDGQGIEITPCLTSGDATDPGSVMTDDVACMADSVTILNITDNNIVNSGLDGILICCGLFQFPLNQAPPEIGGPAGAVFKSVIADNEISHSGEDGIDLDTTIGINVEHNEVFDNGTAALDGDNGIEIDWQFAWEIWNGTNNIPSFTFKVPAHFNRISENSIYDNVGLGINLIGTFNTLGSVPASGTEWGTLADGVGCKPFVDTPITANDCIPYPKLLFTGGDTIAEVSGTACGDCYVEIFLADATPADQTGPLNRQHGEGRVYLVTTRADTLGDFAVDLPCGLSGGNLTATATDKLKNTSEFASNVPFPGTPSCPGGTPVPTDDPGTAEPTSTPVPPEPTATTAPVEPTATSAPAGLCGDVNSDGVVNSVDASLILQKAAGIIDGFPKPVPAGDVNNDGVTNSIDASIILQMAAAMIGPGGLSCP